MTEVIMEHKILLRYPLGNPTRVWKQDNFVLSQFEAFGNNMRKTVKAMADVAFDTVETEVPAILAILVKVIPNLSGEFSYRYSITRDIKSQVKTRKFTKIFRKQFYCPIGF